MDATRESADGVRNAAHINNEWMIDRAFVDRWRSRSRGSELSVFASRATVW
jgi:hypothetical protein